MNGLANSFAAVAVILLLTAMGYFMAWKGWLTHEHKPFLVKLIMNVALPCMCANSLLGSVSRDLLASSGVLLLASLFAITLLFALSLALGKALKLPKERFGVFVVMCSVANSMFIGYPMCLELFGDAAIPFVLCYYIVNTTFFQTVGIAMLCSGNGQKLSLGASLKRVVKPPLIMIVVCVALILLDFQPPHLFMSFFKYMGNTVSPLGLIYTGLVLYELVRETGKTGLGSLKPDASVWLVTALRFVAAPAAILLFCKLLGITGLAENVLMVEIAMPVMTQVVVLSAECGSDEGYAAIGTCVTTVACFAAIPLLMLFVG